MSGGQFLSPTQQINHCVDKGIQFNGISKTKAKQYLEQNNNYFKLRAFRKNFQKDKTTGKYINLDFADLVDLAIIDNRLRAILLCMTLNIEHFSKVHLLQVLQNKGMDGYDIVQNYLQSLTDKSKKRLFSDINKNKDSIYCHDLYCKYINDDNSFSKLPVWVLIEIISFGQYLDFYKYCANLLEDKTLKDRFYLMRTSKNIRNASAHNNCIINNLLLPQSKNFKPNFKLSTALSNVGMSKAQRKTHLNHIQTYQILVCLYTHILIVSSAGVHNTIAHQLHEFSNRLYRDRDYNRNNTIKYTFNMLQSIIDKWFNLV